MTDPIEALMDEHRVIELVLTALERSQDRDDVPIEFFERAVDFISNFADGCHHEKEEEALFPALERRGIPRREGPIGVMLDEHAHGRDCVARIRTAIADGDVDAAKDVGREYAALLRDHIAKEDNVLFQIARDVLPRESIADLEEKFAEIESRQCDVRYRALASELLDEMGGIA